MLRGIWQNIWATLAQTLLKWFEHLFGWGFWSPSQVSKVQPPRIKAYKKKVEPLKLLDDADYEFLFMQLLEGVAYGWEQKRVLRFLAALESRTNEAEWVAWLRRFGERLLATPMPNYQLAAQMISLGEVGCGNLGEVAKEIGKRLLRREENEQIIHFLLEDVELNGKQIEAQAAELISVNDYLSILPPNDSLVERIAKLMQIETREAQEIIEALIDRFFAINAINNKSQEWFQKANQQYMNGNILAAIASYDKVLSIKPKFHDAWYNRGVALKDLGRYEEAILSYDRALELQPDSSETWNNRGAALRSLGRVEEAIASYDRALELKEDRHKNWYNRGIALFNLGRIEDAIASYDKALQLQPDFHQAWNNRGNAFMKLGRFAEAIANYDKALEIKPDKAEAWNNRGTALFNSSHLEEAISSYDKALSIQPHFDEARQNRENVLRFAQFPRG
ncbi:tetratricopeptide repeat protein [Argonema antarcticum]|uniref:tetratricopeptide repeat protein n=1 Tax=Argonema antarcticum TaxID=2942763 RepID=UPI0020136059|nr:tetratricopeptide repeat protein [Argonema antarcticum]MCL1471404.1 tetratricopeptide repeat protein [Argonema antarcticum A004/B2]